MGYKNAQVSLAKGNDKKGSGAGAGGRRWSMILWTCRRFKAVSTTLFRNASLHSRHGTPRKGRCRHSLGSSPFQRCCGVASRQSQAKRRALAARHGKLVACR